MNMREEFEAKFAKKTATLLSADQANEFAGKGGFEAVFLGALAEDRFGETYRNNVFAAAWWAWQTSRASLVVELPRPDAALTDPDLLTVAKGTLFDCLQAIEAAGLKVKP